MAAARRGEITAAMAVVAAREQLAPELVQAEVARGRLVIPANIHHLAGALEPMAIGKVARVKINANIGNSAVTSDLAEEVGKLQLAVKYGADTVMDLSTGQDIDMRCARRSSPRRTVPIGTVPIYQAVLMGKELEELTANDFLDVIEHQARQGVDYMTLHAGILFEHLPLVYGRVTGIVSRGGSLHAVWMMHHRQPESAVRAVRRRPRHPPPVRRHDLARRFAPAGLVSTTRATARSSRSSTPWVSSRSRAWERDVQVMVEGPGHIPMHQIEMNVRRHERGLSARRRSTLSGRSSRTSRPGYDHISSAIGAAMIGWYGADMLCYVTPKEHLGLPNAEDVRQGVIAYKIAAHAADIARGRPRARDRDDALSRARYAFDWNEQFRLSLDPERAREYHDETLPAEYFKSAEFCAMCGPKFCSMHHSRTIDEGIAAMAREAGLVAEPAAEQLASVQG